MLTLLRRRNFALLWFGGLISMAGDWMLRIALPAHVFTLTGSTLATGAMFMAGMLPSLLLGSVAGVFVDRWDRRWTMVLTNLVLAVCVLPLALVSSTGELWIVYVVAVLQSSVGQFFGPAENALLPTLVGEEHLVTANALNALNNNLARLVGPALGGIVAATVGLTGVALIDAATFLVAAALIGLIRVDRAAPDEPSASDGERARISITAVWREWIAGLAVVRHSPLLALLFTIIAIVAVGEGIVSVLFVPFVTEALGGKALELGWLMSAQAVGGLLGGLVIAQAAKGVSPYRLLGPCTLLFGLIDLVIFVSPLFYPSITLQLVLFVLVGLPAAGFGASLSTLLQHGTSDAYRGRVFGAQNTTFALLTLCGMGLASVLGDIVGIVPVISLQGGVYIAAGFLALAGLRRFASSQTQPSSGEPVVAQEAG